MLALTQCSAQGSMRSTQLPQECRLPAPGCLLQHPPTSRQAMLRARRSNRAAAASTGRPCVRVAAAPVEEPTQALAQAAPEEDPEAEEERAFKVLQQCTRRIRELGERGRVKDAIKELASLSTKNVQPDTVAATALVRACCKDMELAQSVFDELFGDFLEPDEVAFAVLLRGYGNANPPNWPRIDSTLTTMQLKYGLAPAATSYNALLEICCRTNDVERGEDIIDRMHSDEVVPDEFTEAAVANRRTLRSYLRKVFS